MANYGRDYTEGRYTRRNTGFGNYDDGYRGSNRPGWGFDQSRDRYPGNQGFGRDRENGWGGRGQADSFGGTYRGGARDFQSGFDDSWSSPGQGWGGSNFNARSGSPYSGYFDRPPRGSSFGPSNRYFGDRGHHYDEDFGDRLRRGWNRFREEARDWMGRGYDRGW